MTGGSGAGQPAVAGGSALHIPVLTGRIVELLQPRDGGIYLDGTFGAGGHTRALLAAAHCRVIAIDRDQSAVARAVSLVESTGGRLTVVEDNFSALDQVAASMGAAALDGVIIDLGVSSMQLDQAERGFSFRLDGPLDMRMSGEGPSAGDVVAAASERDLGVIIATLGEERFARSVARAIARRRAEAPIRTTRDLADVVGSVVRSRPNDIHPATRTFQALRMFVNQELEELAEALLAAERILAPGGRIAVIAFHSLEDRIVKRFLADRARPAASSRHRPVADQAPRSFRLLTSKPIAPDAAEIASNPRARSAHLRVGERTDAPVSNMPVAALPELPSLADVLRGR